MDATPYPRPKGALIILVIVLAFVMGGLGALAVLSWVGSSGQAAQLLDLQLDQQGNGRITGSVDRIVLEESSAVIDTASKVSPAVVSILTTRNVRDLFGRVFEQQGGGTGFIITNDGLILTNKHVVEAQADYTVLTTDGRDFTAKVLAIDPLLDLAILKIEATGLPVVELGNSDDLAAGQWVVAIGNALAEFQNTVTVGVVSATDRQITAGGSDRLEGLIQTDAAINPGNSGGPLVNLRGQVIGINTAVAGGAQNIGFAIPINLAKTAIDSVKETGRIIRPVLGIRYLPITKEVARLEGLPVEQGALLIRGSQAGQPAVLPDSPAAKAGLTEGDIITAINTEQITERRSLARLLQQYRIGDTITLAYLRDGEQQTVQVTLEEFK